MFPDYTQQISQMLAQGLSQPVMQAQPLLQQPLLQQGVVEEHVAKVSGRPGANALNMAPNSDKLALDNTASIVWLIETDSAGYKTLIPYDITPHKEDAPVDDYKSLEERITKLEEKVNEQSNNTSSKQRKSSE